MIPITRKDHYLNEIVGWGDTAPEKPYIEEEFFFAEILGEAVQAPEPLPRYQMYLAKIAGRNIDIPYPKTRLEYFLAKAAGMDITVPVPITREEIYWSNYTAIVEFEVEGVPPLTYKAIEGTLKNYRIYGNTETLKRSYSGSAPLSFPITDGTVSNYRVYGQTSRNLFNFNTVTNGYRITWATGALISDETAIISDFIPVKENNYQINISAFVACYNSEKIYLGIYSSNGYIKNYSSAVKSFTIDNNCKYIKIFTFSNSNTPVSLSQDTMLNSGSALLPYEPYGESVGNLVTDSQSEHYGEYAIPITNNSETANIYLDEPLTKSGDNVDYVDYAEQKRHNADGTSEDVTLPDLPAQSSTNSLSVGTAVQPSSVAVDVAEVVSCGDKITDSQSVNYGKYKIPVTLTADSAETTDIYLDEPLAKSGNNTDYIDYATQKRYNADGTTVDVELPTLQTVEGTNTLSVGTEVQPSKVYIKGEKEREYT